VLALVKA